MHARVQICCWLSALHPQANMPAGAKVSVVETRAYREEQANVMATQQANAALQQQEGSEQAGMRGKLAPISLQVDGLQAQVRVQQGTALAAEIKGTFGGRSAQGLVGFATCRQQAGTRWKGNLLASSWASGTGEPLQNALA